MSGERYRQARELRGLTQVEVAENGNVAQSHIANIEAELIEPSDALQRSIAFLTGFPVSHFQQGAPPDFTLGSLLFRSRTAMTATERRAAFRYAQIAFELYERLGARLKTPFLRVPRIEEPPAEAARMMRSALDISPHAPVAKLVKILEQHGVIVLASPAEAEDHDAFSLWAGANRERAVIVIAPNLPGDRQRHTVSHELRHITSTGRGSKQEIEADANSFAAEFLLPEEAMREELVPPITLAGLAALKPRWGASLQSLIRRSKELHVINERQYKYLMQQIGARGWRTKEPIEIPVERPRGLRQMAEMLYGKPIDYVRLASDMKLSTVMVRRIIELHAGASSSLASPQATGKVLTLRSK